MRTLKTLSLILAIFFMHGCASAKEAENVRSSPLAIEGNSGCRISQGVISLFEAVPAAEKGRPLVIEAEEAYEMFFQKDVWIRKTSAIKTAGGQHYASEKKYAPQQGEDASGGKYIDYCTHALYLFKINQPGEYTVWTRNWIPRALYWRYYLQLDKTAPEPVNFAFSGMENAPTEKWLWKKCFSRKLNKGTHSIVLTKLHNGKRADKIVLTRQADFKPEGIGPEKSPARKVGKASVTFAPFKPVGLSQWQSVSYTNSAGGKVEFQVSIDRGKNFQPVADNGDLSFLNEKKADKIILRAVLSRENGVSPKVSDVKVKYRFDKNRYASLQNDFYRVFFAKETGEISGIENLKISREYTPFGYTAPLFRVMLKTPGKKDSRWITSRDAKLLSFEQKDNRIKIVFGIEDGRIKITTAISETSSPLLKWKVSIENNHPELDVLELVSPEIPRLRVAEKGGEDTLAWPYTAGQFVKNPSSLGELTEAYPGHAGFAFCDLFTPEAGFYLACHDPCVVSTTFKSSPAPDRQSINLSITKRHRIPAGGGKHTYTQVMGIHPGDWHWGALAYRKFFYSTFPKSRIKRWLRAEHCWKVGKACGHVGDPYAPYTYDRLQKDFKAASFLGLDYLQNWGSTFNGSGGTYFMPRKERGGTEMLEKNIRRWRSVGGNIGFYFHANFISVYWTLTRQYFDKPWSEYPEEMHPPSFEWLNKYMGYSSPDKEPLDKEEWQKKTDELDAKRRAREFKTTRNIGEWGFFKNMSWNTLDGIATHLEKWIGYYVKEIGCNTAYLDTYAFHNDMTEFNPFLNMHGEGDRTMYKLKWLEKELTRLRKIEPSFSWLSEGINDVMSPHMYFLLSNFSKNPRIIRYALPDVVFFEGMSNGNWTESKAYPEISRSFIHGNRLDILRVFHHTYHMLRLRQRMGHFLNFAAFNDTIGLEIDNPKIKAFAHVMTAESDEIIKNNGSRTAAVTFWNNEEIKGAKTTYSLPEGFDLKSAWVLSLYDEDPKPLEYKKDGGKVAFTVPEATSSAVIFVDTLADEHCFSLIPHQSDNGTIRLRIFNFSDKPLEMKISAKAEKTQFRQPEKNVTLAQGKITEALFKDAQPREEFRIAEINVQLKDFKKHYVISLGETGQKIPGEPRKKVSVKTTTPAEENRKVKTVTLLREDYEGEKGNCTTDPFRGKKCLRIEGNGGFKAERFKVDLQPETEYRFSMAVKKSKGIPFGRKEGWKSCYAAILYLTPEKKYKIVSYWGPMTPSDEKWHVIGGRFKTGKKLGKTFLYVYNKNSKDNVWIDDIILEEILEQ